MLLLYWTNSSVDKEKQSGSIPVLTYHGISVNSDQYRGNDHIALQQDLDLIHSLGKRIIPLAMIADWVSGRIPNDAATDGVGLSFDDGSWFDFYDLDHPLWGKQRSMLNILRDFGQQAKVSVHATSFVIASPDARNILDKTCMIGEGWWTDDWWAEASTSGLMAIGNHSWDHRHPTLPEYQHAKGGFEQVDDYQQNFRQIVGAQHYIAKVISRGGAKLFAYPFGQYSDYTRQKFLPKHGVHSGLQGAFTTAGRPAQRSDDPWAIPRLVFGEHWDSSAGLREILTASEG